MGLLMKTTESEQHALQNSTCPLISVLVIQIICTGYFPTHIQIKMQRTMVTLPSDSHMPVHIYNIIKPLTFNMHIFLVVLTKVT